MLEDQLELALPSPGLVIKFGALKRGLGTQGSLGETLVDTGGDTKGTFARAFVGGPIPCPASPSSSLSFPWTYKAILWFVGIGGIVRVLNGVYLTIGEALGDTDGGKVGTC